MSKPIIKYVELRSGCGLSSDSKAAILRRHGTDNVSDIRDATQEDINYVRMMGGFVPDGRVAMIAAAPRGKGE